ncbi:DUF4369 domain-containing protein [Xylanibacter muris]|uniref:DUF4369 domain-containing protein n=1 Tax=Xylanibacter muris TaxID=2736290 RepID=A0ABX2ANK4_9BACT|nr:DUF4369 domain-containing protein [Xylanibacter muris]NPD92811.1 DUF4369 domain-containing protein [Xylanibacter muris]
MNRFIYVLAVAAAFVSCADSYNIEGASSVSALDGSKLYLKAIKNNELKDIDSCDVVHGQFHFSGTLDTVRMANLFMDDESIMPVVLEKGPIFIKIDNASQTVGGTPLNDELYDFIDKHKQLENRISELSHKHSQMLLDGIDENLINEQLTVEADKIAREEDSLVTSFIVDNFDNVLGPGVFMMITGRFHYPILTPQIEDIMSKATDKFRNHPYVKDYYQTATENEARMQGFDTPADMQEVSSEDTAAVGVPFQGGAFDNMPLSGSNSQAAPSDNVQP